MIRSNLCTSIICVERATKKVNVMWCALAVGCWGPTSLHPELKPKNMAGGDGRQRERSRDRSGSREKGGEVSKRRRDKSPYPKARRVSRERDDTDRDSDESQ